MYIETLQNDRNTIIVVAILTSIVTCIGKTNLLGGIYLDGPTRRKSIVGKTITFNVSIVSNEIAYHSFMEKLTEDAIGNFSHGHVDSYGLHSNGLLCNHMDYFAS